MKRLFFSILLTVSFFGVSAFAQSDYQSSNLDRYANDLKRQTVDLADRTSSNISRGGSVSRADMEEAFLAAQIDASAGLFQQIIRANRSASELRDAASFLSDIARRAPGYGSNSNGWRNVKNSISDINRELGNNYPGGGTGGGNGGGGNGGGSGQISGHVFWRGTVDDKIQIIIHDQDLRLQTISGRETYDANFSFTTPLPNRKSYVEVNKQKGRGDARVIQQPSRDNDFTTVIEVSDSGSGAKEYQLDIYWR